MSEDFDANTRTFTRTANAIADSLRIFECATPGGGVYPGGHCAACCYGTGYVVTCKEEDELVSALSEARAALTRFGIPPERPSHV